MQYNGKISFDAAYVSALPVDEFLKKFKGFLKCNPDCEVDELKSIHAACCEEAGVKPVKPSKQVAE